MDSYVFKNNSKKFLLTVNGMVDVYYHIKSELVQYYDFIVTVYKARYIFDEMCISIFLLSA